MWQEVLDLLVGGYITLPENVFILFTDANNGNLNINSNVSKYADGAYIHNAAWPGNQLTEAIPVDRLIISLGNFTQVAKSTTFLVDNLSDIKPAMMTADFILRFLWDPTPYQQQDAVTAAKAHYAAFAAVQLHADGATASSYADIWHDYFTVPFIAGSGAPGGFISTDKLLGSYRGAQRSPFKTLHSNMWCMYILLFSGTLAILTYRRPIICLPRFYSQVIASPTQRRRRQQTSRTAAPSAQTPSMQPTCATTK